MEGEECEERGGVDDSAIAFSGMLSVKRRLREGVEFFQFLRERHDAA